MTIILRNPIVFLVCVLGSAWVPGAELPSKSPKYFRHDAGIAAEESVPLPVHLDLPACLRWRERTDSGHSTPVLWDDKIFLTTFRPTERELATVALDRDTGRLLWRRVAPVQKIETFHSATGSPAAPSPACDGQRLVVFFGSCGLLCYDLAGQLIWQHPLGPFQDEFGTGSSPILAGNKVIVSRDQDINSFLIALDVATGKVIWRTARTDAVRSYSTPVVWRTGRSTQLLVAGALELAGYELDTGTKAWWINGLARIVIPMPIAGPDLVYMASWSPGADAADRLKMEPWTEALANHDKNGDGRIGRNELNPGHALLERFFRMDLDQDGTLDQREWERHAVVFSRAQNAVLAIHPGGKGDLTETAIAWKYQRGIPYVSTPLVHRGILWMVKDGGIVTKLDAATGELLHQERLPGMGNYHASPVTGDGKVYFASERGVVSVVANQREWEVIASHDFKEKIYATPVLHENRIYLRTEKALYCFSGEVPQ
jgi:outer membrane protein assembly factor BamB